MHIGHNNTAIFAQRFAWCLRNSWRLALMATLFAATCWEVNPAQTSPPGDGPVRATASVLVVAGTDAADQVRLREPVGTSNCVTWCTGRHVERSA